VLGALGIGVDKKLNISDFDLKQGSLRHQWSGKGKEVRSGSRASPRYNE